MTLAGDGIRTFLQVALNLATLRGGLVLIEEPETHQHPGAIRRTAKVLLAAVRRGVQVVVTTHSLELIDDVLDEADDDDLARLALFNLALRDGELRSARYSGTDVAFARTELERDLR